MLPYNIRVGTEKDIPQVVSMSERLHRVSPYKGLPFSPKKVERLSYELLDTGVILLSDDGMLAGRLIEPHFSAVKLATELFWWSFNQNPTRKLKEELALHDAFEYWAIHVAKADAVQSGSFRKSKYFTRRGYIECETPYLYVKEN